MHWKILSSTHPLKDRYISIRADRCEMPDGHLVDPYYVYESSDFVHTVALTEENQLVMVRQYRHGAGIVTLETPGGHVDSAETHTPLITAQRELLEEAGYGGGTWQALPTVYPNPAKRNNKMHSFLAKGVKKISEQHLDETEEMTVELIPLEQIKKMLYNGEINAPFHITAISFALNALGLLEVR